MYRTHQSGTIDKTKIEKLLDENPDLSREFIQNILVARQETLAGELEPYEIEKP